MSILTTAQSRGIRVILAALATAAAAAAGAQQAVRHDFLTIGEKSGEQVVTTNTDGSVTVTFSFNDRGRGPDSETRFRLDDRGLPTMISISGLNYLKAEIQEDFSRSGDGAMWQSELEQGASESAENHFFWPANGPPEFSAVLARALLKADGGQLPLLPAGTARIETLGTRTVTGSDGESRTITMHAIHGLGDSPEYVWLDADLNFYGVDYGWFAVTPAGWGETYQVLKKAQDEDENQRLAAASARLQTDMNGLVAITNVDLFDSLSGTMMDDQTVYVMDGFITSVVDAADAELDDAEVIDGTGKTMIPGLWDMHGHVSATYYFNYLGLGITNVRDMANDPAFIIKTRNDIRSGDLAGPEIYPLGFIDKDSEFAAPTGMLADSLEEAIAFVDYYARHGFVGIKLYSSIEPQWVAPIADHAHSLGLTVHGHVPAYMEATDAIKGGYDEITHINMAMLDLLDADDVDTRTPLRFTVPGSQGSNIDVDGDAMDALIELMKANDTAIDPTLAIFLDMFLNEPGEYAPSHRHTADHYPPGVRRSSLSSRGRNYGDEENFALAAATASAMVKRFYDEGITVLAGTDNLPYGYALLAELRAYVEAGIPEAAVLQLATIGAARHMGRDQNLGSITPGKRAHLVLLNGNPLEDIGALLRTDLVIKDRYLYVAPDLLREQGYLPFE